MDAVRGDLRTLRLDGCLGDGETCVADNLEGVRKFVDTTPTPNHGDGPFWLLRSAPFCNLAVAGGS